MTAYGAGAVSMSGHVSLSAPGATGALRATRSDRRPLFGTPIDFYVGSEKVCQARIDTSSGHAVCTDPTAVAKAVAAGGYEARYAGSSDIYSTPGRAGLVNTA